MSIINNWLHSCYNWIIESEDGFTKAQNIMLGGRKGPRWEQRRSTDTQEVLRQNPRSQLTHLQYMSKLSAKQLRYKDLQRGTNKIMSTE